MIEPAYLPGDRVHVGGDIPATITAVCVRLNGAVSYEARWWDGRCTREDWFSEKEILPR